MVESRWWGEPRRGIAAKHRGAVSLPQVTPENPMPDSGGGRGWKHPWWEGRVHAMGQKILLSEGIDLQSVVKSPGGEGVRHTST